MQAGFFNFKTALEGHDPILSLPGLRGAGLPLAVADLVISHRGPVLLIAPDEAMASALRKDLRFFLEGTESGLRLHPYPASDVAPFESLSPHSSITAARMAALAALLVPRGDAVVIASVGALLKRVIPRAKLSSTTLDIAVGEEVDRDLLAFALEESGFRRSALVEDVGEYALRGGLVDFWSPLSPDPTRIELSGDHIHSIRAFSPTRQTTKKHLDRARIFACREAIVDDKTPDHFAAAIRPLAEAQNIDRRVRDRLVEEVRDNIRAPGQEFLLPLFYKELDTIASYLPAETVICVVEPDMTELNVRTEEEVIAMRHELAVAADKLCVPVASLYQGAEELFQGLEGRRRVNFGGEPSSRGQSPLLSLDCRDLSGLRNEILARTGEERMLEPLTRRLEAWREEGFRVALVARTDSGVDRLRRLLATYDLPVEMDDGLNVALVLDRPPTRRFPLLKGELSAGVVIPGARIALITEEEIFGPRKHAEKYRGKRGEPIADFGDLKEGDPVVHRRYGIGLYRGLVRLQVQDTPGEFLHLEYAGQDKLYVPIDRLSQVQRYVGAQETYPKLDKLGGTGWERTKARTRAAVREMAKQLIKLYAERETRVGHAFDDGGELFEEFEATFLFDETPDQEEVIRRVLADMRDVKPMDRLVCGDVGFGKTEVALRAAFLAVLDGKQVAVLVPTTTLAFQHGRTFAARMSPFGVKVNTLSRFTSPKERKTIRRELADGTLDVVIGTHQILSKTLRFADLGLLVVDEEQLFGVAQKERIKTMKALVDVLTMTATPIPRTLNMSLTGIRDMSLINTPPEDRLAVRTFLTRWDEDTLRQALTRELNRGGQAFVIHNRVESIDGLADRVRRLVPKARVRVGHGRMPGEEIERLLIDFAEGRFDILVATTIVGSGLDYPRANTMIIHQAEMLGLAQLYQLRGRVGRSKVRAYCYLIIPDSARVTPKAQARLGAIRTFTELGSGYRVAAKDMEIRGAGNLLGGEQSGQIAAVGYELYRELLDEEVHRLKGEEPPRKIETEMNLPIPAMIPEVYIPEESLRLAAYKRVADAREETALDALRDEFVDRFGGMPEPVRDLFSIMGLKNRARDLGITAIDYAGEELSFSFPVPPPAGIDELVEMIRRDPGRYRLLPEGKLIRRVGALAPSELLDVVEKGLIRWERYVTNQRLGGNV